MSETQRVLRVQQALRNLSNDGLNMELPRGLADLHGAKVHAMSKILFLGSEGAGSLGRLHIPSEGAHIIEASHYPGGSSQGTTEIINHVPMLFPHEKWNGQPYKNAEKLFNVGLYPRSYAGAGLSNDPKYHELYDEENEMEPIDYKVFHPDRGFFNPSKQITVQAHSYVRRPKDPVTGNYGLDPLIDTGMSVKDFINDQLTLPSFGSVYNSLSSNLPHATPMSTALHRSIPHILSQHHLHDFSDNKFDVLKNAFGEIVTVPRNTNGGAGRLTLPKDRMDPELIHVIENTGTGSEAYRNGPISHYSYDPQTESLKHLMTAEVSDGKLFSWD